MAAPVPEKERRGGWMVTYRAFCWSVIRALKRRLGDSACPEGRIGTAGFEIQRPPCGAVVLSALTRTTNRIGAHRKLWNAQGPAFATTLRLDRPAYFISCRARTSC